jgi:hypothetical protein
MELPFAVAESPLQDSIDNDSLVTANSDGDTSNNPAPIPEEEKDEEVIDFFTYVNVQETDADEVDVLLAGGDPGMMPAQGLSGSSSEQLWIPPNVLTLFLSGRAEDNDSVIKVVDLSEQANEAVKRAAAAKQELKLPEALDAHSTAAKLFYEAALLLKETKSSSMANSFLILSQIEAKSALALKRVIKLRPNMLQTKELLRATVRGALEKKAEADISDSIFLGTVTGDTRKKSLAGPSTVPALTQPTKSADPSSGQSNPVDDIMQLEQELRNMDMGLEPGNSIASLDNRSSGRLKSSTIDGSFMVVPPGSNSYLSSSMVLPATPARPTPTFGRARANRIQNMIGGSSTTPRASRGTNAKPLTVPPPPPTAPGGLESSWWGTASQVLSSSTNEGASFPVGSSSHNKQLMRLMDSLKTLTDENAALMREVEEAEAARAEAKAARQEMRVFREAYSERFEKLKAALEKFRKGHSNDDMSDNGSSNPVVSSEYMNRASTLEQNARQEQLIRKLTADLKKEKEENKRKDAAIRKYESFYREVKARSAQKAAQRVRQQQQQQQQQRRPTSLSSKR